MARLSIKNLVTASILGLFLFGTTGVINAQQSLPKGGDSFETAVKIEPGSYKGGSLDNNEEEYFYITDIEFGQEIDIKGTFVAADVESGAWAILTLYDKDRAELAVEEEGFYDEPLSLTISQTHRDKDLGKYYIQTKCDTFKIASFTLEVSLKEPPAEESGNGTSVSTETPAEGTSAEGPNWTLILGVITVIAVIVIVGAVAYLLLKRKK